MILYHASTMYHLLCCIVHKCIYRKEKQATLLIVEYLQNKEVLDVIVERLVRLEWFEKIVIVPERKIKALHLKTLSENSRNAQIKKVLYKIIRGVKDLLQIDFSCFEEINMAGDYWSVGLYLRYNQIPFNYFEDGSGMLSQCDRYNQIIQNTNTTHFIIAKYLNSIGKGELIQKKYADLSNQSEGFYDELAVDFSIYELINKMDKRDVLDLLSVFGCTLYCIEEGVPAALFLTQYFKTMQIKSVRTQELLTTMLLDYFAPNFQIIIKPHPKDRRINYRRLLPGCIVLKNYFPSELIPFSIIGEIKLGLTASSTSISGIKHFVDQTISFSTDIETSFSSLHKLYAANTIAHAVTDQSYIFLSFGAGSELLDQLRHQVNPCLGPYSHQIVSGEKRCIIFNNVSQQCYQDITKSASIAKGDIVIFVDTLDKVVGICDDIMDNVLPISIKKNSSASYDKTVEKEIIYVYTSDPDIREFIMNYEEKKELKLTGLSLEIRGEKIQEQIRIKVLEAQVRALKEKCYEYEKRIEATVEQGSINS